jgi:hypothetical protein
MGKGDDTMTTATTAYPMFALGAYTFVVIPRKRNIDGANTFTVQIYDDERDADICNNPIGWVSDMFHTMAAFDDVRFATFKALGITVKSILKAARALV